MAASPTFFNGLLDAKRLYGAVQLATQVQQAFTLAASVGDQAEVVVAQLVDAFAMFANLTDRIALLGSGLGDAPGHAGDGADGADDLVQRTIGRFGLARGRFGVFDLGTHGLYRLMRGLLQAADDILDFRGGAAGAL